MSIYGTIFHLEEDSPPYRYYHSGHTPNAKARGGLLEIGAATPNGEHIPFLRIGVMVGNEQTVVLDLEQVKAMRDALSSWIGHFLKDPDTERATRKMRERELLEAIREFIKPEDGGAPIDYLEDIVFLAKACFPENNCSEEEG